MSQASLLPGLPELLRGPLVGELGDHDLVTSFESLGASRPGEALARLQAALGMPRDSLLRLAVGSAEDLAVALQAGFDGLGHGGQSVISTQPDGRLLLKDTRYDLVTPVWGASVRMRLQMLRRQLLADLAANERIFVYYAGPVKLDEAVALRLHAAMQIYGQAALLIVKDGDWRRPTGAVETLRPDLFVAWLDSPAPQRAGLAPGAAQAWLRLLRSVYRLRANPTDTFREGSLALPSTRPSSWPADQPRRIVAVGNCQVAAMAELYRRFAAGSRGDTITAVASYTDLDDAARTALREADIVIEQVMDVAQKAEVGELPRRVERLLIPSVSCAFLWPFAGQAHPRNTPTPFLAAGPYGGEAGDSYLNRAILAGAEPEVTVEDYMALNVPARINIDRLYELTMDRQRARDRASGYQIAPLIEAHFRSEPVFRTPFHPNTRIAVALAAQMFEQLGVEAAAITRMRGSVVTTLFPADELPVHPTVAAHFGVSWVTPDRRYRYMHEGAFTFRDYALRYMRFEWNEALEEGLHLLRSGAHAEAELRLQSASCHDPHCASAWAGLSRIYADRGDMITALAMISKAIEREPGNAADFVHFGNLLRQQGQLAAAEAAYCSALIAEPGEPDHYLVLATLLRELGRIAEAGALLDQAAELDPFSLRIMQRKAALLQMFRE